MEPGKRLNAGPLAGSDEAPQHRRRLPAGVAAEEDPVAAAHRDVAVGPFRGAFVDLQLTVFRESVLAPSIQCIAHLSTGRTLWQNLRLQLQQILVELAEQPH